MVLVLLSFYPPTSFSGQSVPELNWSVRWSNTSQRSVTGLTIRCWRIKWVLSVTVRVWYPVLPACQDLITTLQCWTGLGNSEFQNDRILNAFKLAELFDTEFRKHSQPSKWQVSSVSILRPPLTPSIAPGGLYRWYGGGLSGNSSSQRELIIINQLMRRRNA